MVYEQDGRFHTTECYNKGWCSHPCDPTPCGSELSIAQIFSYGPKWNQRKIELKTCPANIVQQEHFQYLQLYAMYKDGFLPIGGGIAEQSAKYVQAMRVIASEVNAIDQRKAEKDKKKHK